MQMAVERYNTYVISKGKVKGFLGNTDGGLSSCMANLLFSKWQ